MHSILLVVFTFSFLSSIKKSTSFNTNYLGKLSLPEVVVDKRRRNIRPRIPFLLHSAPPRRTRIEDNTDHYYHNPKDVQDGDKKSYQSQSKSIEKSSFWYNVPNKPPLSQEEAIPYQSKLDTAGQLPYGAYKLLGREEYESKRTCILSVALDFWSGRNADDNNNASTSSINTDQVIKNVHQLIDSGFTSFQLYNTKPLLTKLSSPVNSMSSSSYNPRTMDPSSKQIFTEQIYQQIIKQTPVSVVNQCSFATRINIPPLKKVASYYNNYNDNNDSASSSSIFSQRTVREHVFQSIMNMYGNTNGCLDNIQLNFERDLLYINDKGNSENIGGSYMNFQQQQQEQQPRLSPYTFDILDVLNDMQREGYIRSITGLNFPSYSLEEIERNGFELDYNQITCNLLDPTSYTRDFLNQSKKEKRTVLSGALAGGLLTNRYSNVPNSYLNRSGEPVSSFMSKSELWHYNNSLIKSWGPYHRRERGSRRGDESTWQMFQSNAMKTMEDIAYKHHVSIASVILRWSIQLENVGSVVVGSSLNTNFDDDDRPYTRPNDLRKVFSFILDEEDMERLWNVAGGDKTEHNGMGDDNNFGGIDQIDFGNTKLWL